MIFGRIAPLINMLTKLTAFNLQLLYKTNTKWIPLLNTMFQTLVMLLDRLSKSKNTRLAACGFLSFHQVFATSRVFGLQYANTGIH